MKKIIVWGLVFLLFIVNCSQNKTEKGAPTVEKQVSQIPKEHKGKKLLKKHCLYCHNATSSENDRTAPPMIAIKAHYIEENTTKQEFTKQLIDFLNQPRIENAKMKEAVERFGLMPYQAFGEKELREIAEYVYDHQIDEPVWFKKHWEQKNKKPYINTGKRIEKRTPETAAEIGLSYALNAKKVLGKNLMGTIQKKGTVEAISFCNHRAYPLTDSIANQFNATIKRVSDRVRNPKNSANERELELIDKYKKSIANGSEITATVEENNGKTQFYYPIKTNSMCLQCHGTPNEQIKPSVMRKLAELYPQDKAQGYKVNQIRGIWSITFENKSSFSPQ